MKKNLNKTSEAPIPSEITLAKGCKIILLNNTNDDDLKNGTILKFNKQINDDD